VRSVLDAVGEPKPGKRGPREVFAILLRHHRLSMSTAGELDPPAAGEN